MSTEYNSVKEKISVAQGANPGLTINKYQCAVRSLKLIWLHCQISSKNISYYRICLEIQNIFSLLKVLKCSVFKKLI